MKIEKRKAVLREEIAQIYRFKMIIFEKYF